MARDTMATPTNGCPSASDHSGDSPRANEETSSAPLLEDWLYRQSSIVDSVVCQRWGALYKDAIVTFRKQRDSKPSKKLCLASVTVSDEVWSRQYKIRQNHRNTVWSLATGKYSEKLLHGFSLTPSKKDWLMFCFEDLETAKHWHSVVREAVGAVWKDPASRESSSKNLLSRRKSWHKTMIEGGGTHSRKTSDDMVNWTPPNAVNFQTDGVDSKQSPFARCVAEVDKFSEAGSDLDMVEEEAACLEDRTCPFAPFQRKWRSVQHVNGVAVYEENDESGNGAKMVSVVVRCTPASCFKAVMRYAFERCEVIEHVDDHTEVLKGASEGGWLVRSREMVFRRSWRLDADGSFIILLQGVQHDKAQPSAATGYFALVQADIEAVGFIIAPVAHEYLLGQKKSTECLVTTVAKVDMGGWLSKNTMLGRLLAWSPFVNMYTASAWLHPLVNRMIILRDMLEQERFVKKPFETAVSPPRAPPKVATVSSESATTSDQSVAVTRSFRPAFFTSPKSFFEPLSSSLETMAESPKAHKVSSFDEQLERWGTGMLQERFWSCPGNCGFRVRGPNYLVDRKKIPASDPIFALAAVDIVQVDNKVYNIAPYLPSLKASNAPFTFLLNIMVPSSPQLSLVISWVAAYVPQTLTPTTSVASETRERDRVSGPSSIAEDDDVESEQETYTNPFDLCMARFLAGDDERRNGRFKLIPKISEGSWVIKQSVGTTPVILGRKLQTKYFRGEGYFEMDIDIGSSSVAASVVSLVQGATKSLVIDMGVLFEGQATEELPEQLLGSVRLDRMDLGTAPYLDLTTGKIHDRKP